MLTRLKELWQDRRRIFQRSEPVALVNADHIEPLPTAVTGAIMSGFLNIFSLILALTPGIVQALQTLHGDKVAGKDKRQMAKDMLKIATSTAVAALPSDQGAIASAVSAVTGSVIDAAVLEQKQNGTYEAASKVAASAAVPPATQTVSEPAA